MDRTSRTLSPTDRIRREPLWTPSARGPAAAITRRGIERLIPHRDPFLLLDEITAVDLDARAVRGRRRVSPDDPVFRGHFPDRPLYPGVLQLEIIGQLGLCLLQLLSAGTTVVTDGMAPRDARAVRIRNAQFQQPILPGDDLTLLCQAVEVDDFIGVCAGQIWRDGVLCAFGIMEVYFVED